MTCTSNDFGTNLSQKQQTLFVKISHVHRFQQHIFWAHSIAFLRQRKKSVTVSAWSPFLVSQYMLWFRVERDSCHWTSILIKSLDHWSLCTPSPTHFNTCHTTHWIAHLGSIQYPGHNGETWQINSTAWRYNDVLPPPTVLFISVFPRHGSALRINKTHTPWPRCNFIITSNEDLTVSKTEISIPISTGDKLLRGWTHKVNQSLCRQLGPLRWTPSPGKGKFIPTSSPVDPGITPRKSPYNPMTMSISFLMLVIPEPFLQIASLQSTPVCASV